MSFGKLNGPTPMTPIFSIAGSCVIRSCICSNSCTSQFAQMNLEAEFSWSAVQHYSGAASPVEVFRARHGRTSIPSMQERCFRSSKPHGHVC